jgi:hypothetical protein
VRPIEVYPDVAPIVSVGAELSGDMRERERVINFDAASYANLLKSFGVSDEDICALQIYIGFKKIAKSDEEFGTISGGFYSQRANTIFVKPNFDEKYMNTILIHETAHYLNGRRRLFRFLCAHFFAVPSNRLTKRFPKLANLLYRLNPDEKQAYKIEHSISDKFITFSPNTTE